MCIWISHAISNKLTICKKKKLRSSHHATTEVGLDFFWVHIPDIQNVHLSLGTIQDSLTVQHALFKVSWLLEQLVLCGDLPQFPLQWMKGEMHKVIDMYHKTDNTHLSCHATMMLHFFHCFKHKNNVKQ